jgi:hypothetical protein
MEPCSLETATRTMDKIVSCYAGSRYPERPRAFLWEGQWLEVAEIERQWRTPHGPAFRVRSGDGRRFALAYEEASDSWIVEPIARPSSSVTRTTQQKE